LIKITAIHHHPSGACIGVPASFSPLQREKRVEVGRRGGPPSVLLFSPLQRERRVDVESRESRGGTILIYLVFPSPERKESGSGKSRGDQPQISCFIVSREKGEWKWGSEGGGGQPQFSCSLLSREKGEWKWGRGGSLSSLILSSPERKESGNRGGEGGQPQFSSREKGEWKWWVGQPVLLFCHLQRERRVGVGEWGSYLVPSYPEGKEMGGGGGCQAQFSVLPTPERKESGSGEARGGTLI
jgi:hypothetical protein